MFLAAGFRFLLGQLGHLLLDVSNLPEETLVLLLLPVLAGTALVSFLSQLLEILFQPRYKTLQEDAIIYLPHICSNNTHYRLSVSEPTVVVYQI